MLFKGNSSRLEMVIEKIQSSKDIPEVPKSVPGQQSSPSSSSAQASPASSCQSPGGSENIDGDEPFTMGATATTPYECNICKRAFSRSSMLSRHVQSHAEQLKYSCSYCPRLFKHKRSRDRHVKLHTGDKNYKCQLCTGAFSRSDHLKIHLKSHDVNKPHRCDICNRGFTSTSALATHLQKHGKKTTRCGSSASRTSATSSPSPIQNTPLTNQKPNTHQQPSNFMVESPLNNVFKSALDLPKIACMYCGKDFISMNHMYQHIHAEHSAILNSVLPQTVSSSMNYTPLSSPIEDLSPKQSRQNTFPCDRCTMRFETVQNLREHVENVHWRPMLSANLHLRDYPYDMSPQNSLEKPSITQTKPTDLSHKRKSEENSEKPPEKRKVDEANLSKQASPSSAGSPYDANDKPCICSYCYVQLPNFKSFLIHMESHVSLNPSSIQPSSQNQFLGYCPICGEPGRDPLEMSNHIFSHAVSNSVGRCCYTCKKPYEHADQLQKHLMESHAVLIYKCTVCNESFDSQMNIQIHFKNKHSSECRHYRCNLCPDQVFHDRLAAEIHVNLKHSMQLPGVSRDHQQSLLPPNFATSFQELDSRIIYGNFQCPFCQKTFKDEYLQYLHVLKEHSEARDAENYLMEISAFGQRHLPSRSPNFPYTKTMTPPENHSKADQKHNVYVCDICNRNDFTSDAELVAHKKLHHAKSKPSQVSLQCAYCSEHCKSRSDLENHMKSHQVNCGKSKLKCNICDEICSSPNTLADHKLIHCKVVDGNICIFCKGILLDEASFFNHYVQHGTASGVNKTNNQMPVPANCVVCSQTLQNELELKLHSKFHLRHLLQKEFLCGVCNKMFDTQTGVKVAHSSEKNNANIPVSFCKDCIARSSNGSGGSQNSDHQVEKSQLKKYACIQCPQTFDNEEDIQNHASMHMMNDGTNLECHLCRNILPSPLKLQAHLIEHNFVGIGQYTCYVCSSVFTTATGLQNHIISHGLSHRLYECKDCKMKFYFGTELENHRYTHILTNQQNSNFSSKNGEIEYYDSAKAQKLFISCEYCLSTMEETVYQEHKEICKKTSIKKEAPGSPMSTEKFAAQNTNEEENNLVVDLDIKQEKQHD